MMKARTDICIAGRIVALAGQRLNASDLAAWMGTPSVERYRVAQAAAMTSGYVEGGEVEDKYRDAIDAMRVDAVWRGWL